MDIEDGDFLTDEHKTVCKCCGRRMGFAVRSLDQPWGKFYLKFGCTDEPIAPPCPFDTDIPCDENAECPITADDVRFLAIYYLNFFQNLMTNYGWNTVTFELTQDVLLNHLLQLIRDRQLPCCTIAIPLSHMAMSVNKRTKELKEYPQTQLVCVVIAEDRTNLPPNGVPFDFNEESK